VSLYDPTTPSAAFQHISAGLHFVSNGVNSPYHTFGIVTGRDPDGLLTCVDNWSVQYNFEPQTPQFSDQFNRASLGSNYVTGFGAGTIVMQNNELCADTQAVAIQIANYSEPISVDYYYNALNSQDWESYVVAVSDLMASTYGIMGVDSGNTLRISYQSNNAATVTLSNTMMPKDNSTYYHIFAFASSTILAVDLRTFDDRIIAAQVFDIRALGFTFSNFGVLVGRQANGQMTCADNLVVQRQPRNPENDNGQNSSSTVSLSLFVLINLIVGLVAFAF